MEPMGIDPYEAFSEAMCHPGEAGGAIASFLWSIYEKLYLNGVAFYVVLVTVGSG